MRQSTKMQNSKANIEWTGLSQSSNSSNKVSLETLLQNKPLIFVVNHKFRLTDFPLFSCSGNNEFENLDNFSEP